MLTTGIIILLCVKWKGIDEYFSNFNSDVHQLYTYGEGISLQHSKIIVPERKIIKIPILVALIDNETELKNELPDLKDSISVS